MKAKLHKLLRALPYRYLTVGVSIYCLELAIIFGAQARKASPEQAVALSYIIGTLVSFGLQKFVTFGDRRTQGHIILPQLLATLGLVVFNLGFTILVTALLSNLVPTWISRTLALGTTTIWNFYLYKTHIFTKTDGIVT